MKEVIVKKDFILNDKSYIVGDKIDIKDINVITVLNEKGFIEPLDYKDLVILERKLKKEKEEL